MVAERRNINQGFKKLHVWQDAVTIYKLSCELLSDFPFELKKVTSSSRLLQKKQSTDTWEYTFTNT